MYVIAGASGRSGRVVAETLLAEGKPVRVLLRDRAKADGWRQRGAEVELVSLEDESALTRALAGASGFYTLLPEDPGATPFHARRRTMADAIAGAVQAARVPHVVFLSATGAYLAEGVGPVGDLHYAEEQLRGSDATVTALRASYLLDNVFLALPAAQAEGIYPSFLPIAAPAFPMVATHDVGRAAAHCLVEPPREHDVVDLLGPVYTVSEMAAALGDKLGKKLQVVEIPAAAHVDAFARFGVPADFAKAMAEMFAAFAAGRITPKGKRSIPCTTTLVDVVGAFAGA